MGIPSSSVDKLRAALEAENSDSDLRVQRYKSLTAKIADYQVGIGSAPTEEEFTQWLADVKHAVDLKNTLGG